MKKLFILSGVSGVGKTTVCDHINANKLLDNYFSIDIDDLENVHEYEDDYSKFYENAIKKACNLSEDKNILLITCMNPTDLDKISLPEEINEIYFVALTSSKENIIDRLKKRDEERNCSSDEFINSQIDYNNWILNHIDLYNNHIDNSKSNIEETSKCLVEYIKSIEKNRRI